MKLIKNKLERYNEKVKSLANKVVLLTLLIYLIIPTAITLSIFGTDIFEYPLDTYLYVVLPMSFFCLIFVLIMYLLLKRYRIGASLVFLILAILFTIFYLLSVYWFLYWFLAEVSWWWFEGAWRPQFHFLKLFWSSYQGVIFFNLGWIIFNWIKTRGFFKEFVKSVVDDLYEKEMSGVESIDVRQYASQIGFPFNKLISIIKGALNRKEVVGYYDKNVAILYLGREYAKKKVPTTEVATPQFSVAVADKDLLSKEEESVPVVEDVERIKRALENLEDKFSRGEVDEVTYYKLKAMYLEKLRKMEDKT